MPDNLILPSVDLRIGSLEEYNRKQKERASERFRKPKVRPCITISREYGCAGYPVAETVRRLMAERTGEEWVMVDRDVMNEVARHHNLSAEILQSLGEDNRLLHQVLATFSPRWKTNYEYFEPLAKHIVALAEQGNVIILGMGSAVIARHMEHAFHFRIFASERFKIDKLARRWRMEAEEAEKLMHKQQKLRDHFTDDFLNHDSNDPNLYHLLLNNDRFGPERMAHTIADLVCQEVGLGTLEQEAV